MKELKISLLEKGKEIVDRDNIRTMDMQVKFLFNWLNDIDAEKEAEQLYEYYSK